MSPSCTRKSIPISRSSPLRPVTTLTQSSTWGRSVVNVAIRVPSAVIPKARRPAGCAELLPAEPTTATAAAHRIAAAAAIPFLIPDLICFPFE